MNFDLIRVRTWKLWFRGEYIGGHGNISLIMEFMQYLILINNSLNKNETVDFLDDMEASQQILEPIYTFQIPKCRPQHSAGQAHWNQN